MGWTIASKVGLSPLERLTALDKFQVQQQWLTLPMLIGSFEFSNGFYQQQNEIPINYLGNHTIYQLHQKAWRDQQGLENAYAQ